MSLDYIQTIFFKEVVIMWSRQKKAGKKGKMMPLPDDNLAYESDHDSEESISIEEERNYFFDLYQ
ncbi:MAG: hypothetical protein ABH950_04590 [Candidatus Altiarchaeota archaeon]